jgi:hypothetical protein
MEPRDREGGDKLGMTNLADRPKLSSHFGLTS